MGKQKTMLSDERLWKLIRSYPVAPGMKAYGNDEWMIGVARIIANEAYRAGLEAALACIVPDGNPAVAAEKIRGLIGNEVSNGE